MLLRLLRLLACTKSPGKVSSDGFNVCRFLCTGFPRLLTSWALVCSLRCLFVVASVLSGPARFRIDTVLWSCALSPFNASISISVCKASCSVNASLRNSSRQLDNPMQLHWDYLQRQCLLKKQQIMPSIFSQLNDTYRLDYKQTARQRRRPALAGLNAPKAGKIQKGSNLV